MHRAWFVIFAQLSSIWTKCRRNFLCGVRSPSPSIQNSGKLWIAYSDRFAVYHFFAEFFTISFFVLIHAQCIADNLPRWRITLYTLFVFHSHFVVSSMFRHYLRIVYSELSNSIKTNLLTFTHLIKANQLMFACSTKANLLAFIHSGLD